MTAPAFNKAAWRAGPWAAFATGGKGAAGGKGSGKAKRKRTAKGWPAPKPIDDLAFPAGAFVVCPYPPAELNPNARVHWSIERPIAKAYRQACWALALAAKVRAPAGDGPIWLRLDFFPPNRAARDDDNAEAAFKAGRDGIAAAMKVNDAQFRIVRVWHADEPRSCVRVTVLDPSELQGALA